MTVMNRNMARSAAKLVLACGALGLVIAVALTWWLHRVPAGTKGPVVIFLVDALRADRVSVYGSPRDTTPAARALAGEGVVYENAYAVSTWTRPSWATMLTSRLPAECGAVNRFGRLAEDVPYLPELLQGHGWSTEALVSNGNVFDRRAGFRRGFDRLVSIPGQGEPTALGVRPNARARDVVDPAVRYIEEQRSPRFFLFVHVADTHDRIRLEPRYTKLFGSEPAELSSRDRLLLEYDRAARQADDQFARLVQTLRKRGWWRNALVVYTADHGEGILERGGSGHGRTLFEEQIHVPLIIKYPKGAFAGTRRPDPVSHADLAPTIADLCGLKALPGQRGRSLAGAPFDRNRVIYFTEDLDDVRLYGIRRGPNKLIVQLYPTFSRMLFDLSRDPAESHGISVGCAQAEPAGTEELFATLRELRDREAAFFPGVRIVKDASEPMTIRVSAKLGENAMPFLRDTDLCAFSTAVTNGTLVFERTLPAGERFDLTVAANEKGDPVALDLQALRVDGSWSRVTAGTGGPLRLIETRAHYIQGPTTDEMLLRNLRSLGYIH
jgi:arylsulfatase A-like enzyme